MRMFKKIYLLHLILVILNLFTCTRIANSSTNFCGKTSIPGPLWIQNPNNSSLLHRMVLCKSQKLYFRTSIGLFPISSINYSSKTLTISHPSCSSQRHFISPSLLSNGFPSPPQLNSLLLFNCTNPKYPLSNSISNCTSLHGCGTFSNIQEAGLTGTSFCLFIKDLEQLDMNFHPKHFNCSHYSRVYRKTLEDDNQSKYELGTTISFDIPDHVPDVCKACGKTNGNCGVGLRCICHPKECKDRIYSGSVSKSLLGNIIFSLLLFIILEVVFLTQER